MSRQWLSARERSNIFAIRVLVWIALSLGRPVARAVLIPVAAYYLIFDARARQASQDYLQRVLRRKPSLREVFRHLHTFATVALDRVYFLSDRWSMFDIRLHGEERLIEQLKNNKGCFLVGAHIGSFEVLRSIGRRRQVTVNLVMFEENANRVARVTRAINPALEDDVIALGTPDSMLRVMEQLDKGAWVGMLADRAISEGGTVAVPFLGATALFPAAPFRVFALTGRDVILMLGVYRGANRYDLHFETLVEAPVLPRAERDQIVERWIRLYASRLEYYCRAEPFNWFNFYDFWSSDDKVG
ncbi:MAG: acyl-CoA synthetase [Betaproteobacteria bacterium]|nr:MAG: acyl-CoA synthetase [Betaproteobacteria bacterium]